MEAIYCHECKKIILNPKVIRVNRIPFCSELCKAKSCITILTNGCWKPRIMVFTSNGRSYSVRAVLYEKAFGVRFMVKGLAPLCGFKTCANPAHLNFRYIGKALLLEEL